MLNIRHVTSEFMFPFQTFQPYFLAFQSLCIETLHYRYMYITAPPLRADLKLNKSPGFNRAIFAIS